MNYIMRLAHTQAKSYENFETAKCDGVESILNTELIFVRSTP